MNQRHNFLKTIFFLWTTLALSCSGYSITGGPGKTVPPSLRTASSHPTDLVTVNAYILLPVQFDDDIRHLRKQGSSFYQDLEDVAHDKLNLQVISGKEVLSYFGTKGEHLSKSEILSLGSTLGGDAAVQTTLHQYVDRVGSDMNATEGGQVDFSMVLYRTRDGKELWNATYHVKDEALSHNLFRLDERIRKGPRWRSASELFREGLNKAFNDLSAKRTAAFGG